MSPARDTARDPARLRGVDAARGLAVLGMMAAHVAVPRTLELDEPASWLAIADGRSSILSMWLIVQPRTVPALTG